jgi:hypothetical protein
MWQYTENLAKNLKKNFSGLGGLIRRSSYIGSKCQSGHSADTRRVNLALNY